MKVWLHSTGDASPPAALLLAQILPVFSVVAPCRRGGAPNAAAALGTPGRLAPLGATPDFHHGLLGGEPVVLIEFDFEDDTVHRLGTPGAHVHP